MSWEPNYEIPPCTSIDDAADMMLNRALKTCEFVRAEFNGYRLTAGVGMKKRELIAQWETQSRERAAMELATRIENERRIRVFPELLSAAKELLDHAGWRNYSDEELREEERLGNGMAPILLRARAAIEKAEGPPL